MQVTYKLYQHCSCPWFTYGGKEKLIGKKTTNNLHGEEQRFVNQYAFLKGWLECYKYTS